MTSVSLGASLARQGKKVLIVDADSQHSATVNLGVSEPDKGNVGCRLLDATTNHQLNSSAQKRNFVCKRGFFFVPMSWSGIFRLNTF